MKFYQNYCFDPKIVVNIRINLKAIPLKDLPLTQYLKNNMKINKYLSEVKYKLIDRKCVFVAQNKDLNSRSEVNRRTVPKSRDL